MRKASTIVLGGLVLVALGLGVWAITAAGSADLPPLAPAPLRASKPAKAARLSEAEKALRRLRVLNSPAWREAVERSLRVPGANAFEDYDELMWAFEVARLRGLPTLRACLADRLRRSPDEESGGRGNRDLALSLFASEGGVLTAAEFQRLRRNGFVGDAEERLLEIAGDERRR